jgi:wyosine [tRNA(Phe)-imidazoG37] synthetase (radical SAM superfamily)
MTIEAAGAQQDPLFTAHPRGFAENRYVYPVLSRRAGGISIGVNLNPDKACNFRCVYCQVDRAQPGVGESIDLSRLSDELNRMVESVVSGHIYEGPRFRTAPLSLRRLNDIALSGDGEPTASPAFESAIEVCAEVRRRHNLSDVKLVLITNATMLHREEVRRGLVVLDANGGEIWAKLDAGTESYYRAINRSHVPWQRILDNLRETAIVRPIVVQSLWTQIHGHSVPPEELAAYCQRLNEINAAGGRIKLVQIHTVARKPAEMWVAPLTNAQIDTIADEVRRRTALSVAAFYGTS